MNLEVVTPRGVALSTEVDEVTAPGKLGEFGVLPGHTPLLAALKAGSLRWKRSGQLGVMAIGAGFAEVVSAPTDASTATAVSSGQERIIILTESTATPEQVDSAQAKHELDEAEQKLKDGQSEASILGSPARIELETRRDWAQARLSISADSRG